jgi:hypothetical protein
LRFAIDNADDVLPAPNPIVATISPSATNALRGTNSVAFDGNAVHSLVDGSKLYVGYANGGLDIFTVDGTNTYHLKQSFAAGVRTVENGGVKWLDVAADGKTIVYTSSGRKIYLFNTATGDPSVLYADLSTVNNTGSGPLGAIRIPPPGDGSTGVLVADQGDVKLVQAGTFASANGTGAISNIVKFSKFPAQDSTLQALSLDPANPLIIAGTSVTSGQFWAGDANTNDVIWYNAATNRVVSHFTAGNRGTLRGLCVDGSFSPAQLNFSTAASPVSPNCTAAPANGITCNLTPPSNKNPNSNTATFTSPYSQQTLTVTLTDLANPVALTLRDSLVDPSVGLSDPTVFSLIPDSGGLVSTVAGNMKCFQVTSGGVTGCEVFEFEANPNSGYSDGNIQICPPNSPTCSFPSSATSNLPNLRLLKNEHADTTTGLDGLGGRTKCVTTVNTQTASPSICNPATDTAVVGFESPVGSTIFSKKLNSTIAFKFQIGQFSGGTSGACNANTSPPLCSSPGSPGCVTPLLLISQSETGVAPAPLESCSPTLSTQCITVAGGSSQTFLPPVFVLSGNTWQLQIKTSTMNAGSYLATVVDLNSEIPTFSVPFTLQ